MIWGALSLFSFTVYYILKYWQIDFQQWHMESAIKGKGESHYL